MRRAQEQRRQRLRHRQHLPRLPLLLPLHLPLQHPSLLPPPLLLLPLPPPPPPQCTPPPPPPLPPVPVTARFIVTTIVRCIAMYTARKCTVNRRTLGTAAVEQRRLQHTTATK